MTFKWVHVKYCSHAKRNSVSFPNDFYLESTAPTGKYVLSSSMFRYSAIIQHLPWTIHNTWKSTAPTGRYVLSSSMFRYSAIRPAAWTRQWAASAWLFLCNNKISSSINDIIRMSQFRYSAIRPAAWTRQWAASAWLFLCNNKTSSWINDIISMSQFRYSAIRPAAWTKQWAASFLCNHKISRFVKTYWSWTINKILTTGMYYKIKNKRS